ncbi:leg1, partial [Symbiodinium pilosum]
MPLAEYWSSLAAEPLVAEDIFGRQAIYHRLITIDALRGLFPGPQLHGCPTRHFLWAYAVQLDWQWRSGRLGEGRAISPDSWWGCVNYTLSVIPFLAAVDAGLLEPAQLQAPPPELGAATSAWLRFWQDLKEMAQSQEGKPLTERQLDQVQRKLWYCHTESIHAAQDIYKAEFLRMPREERMFGGGWARFVEVLAAIRWRTDLEAVAELGAGYLPLTRLTAEADGSQGALPSEVELFTTGVKTVQQTSTISEGTLRLMVKFWTRLPEDRFVRLQRNMLKLTPRCVSSSLTKLEPPERGVEALREPRAASPIREREASPAEVAPVESPRCTGPPMQLPLFLAEEILPPAAQLRGDLAQRIAELDQLQRSLLARIGVEKPDPQQESGPSFKSQREADEVDETDAAPHVEDAVDFPPLLGQGGLGTICSKDIKMVRELPDEPEPACEESLGAPEANESPQRTEEDLQARKLNREGRSGGRPEHEGPGLAGAGAPPPRNRAAEAA